MTTIAMPTFKDKPNKIQEFFGKEKLQNASIAKKIKLVIAIPVVAGSIYITTHFKQLLNTFNQKPKPNIEQVVPATNDSTQYNDNNTAHFENFVNSQDPQKENIDGGPDSLKIQMQTIIDKYENSENTQIQNVINRFKELSEKNIYDIDNIKANIVSSLDDMLSPNRVDFRPEDLEYITFCEDVNNTMNLGIDDKLEEVKNSDKYPKTATTTTKKKPTTTTAETDDDLSLDGLLVSNADDDLANSEQELAEAKARVENIFKANKNMDDKILEAVRTFYQTTGKNPAEEFDWYEDWAKENGITPEMLISN